MHDRRALDQWCRDRLGAGVAEELFSSGHLATVVGIQLDDGRRVVAKMRPPSPRLAAVVSAQRHLHDAGVPCPRPLVGPLLHGDQAITIESFLPAAGFPKGRLPPDAPAELLASLVAAAPAAESMSALRPAPPWVAWDHSGGGTWPWPDDLDIDLDQIDEEDWIDDAARRVRHLLCQDSAPEIVGHVDWEAHNLGWSGQQPVVVYDMDSLAMRTESAVAGAAATVFQSTTGTTVAASVAASEAFLESYQRRRGPFPREDLRVVWAAGLWVLLYNAKKEVAGGGAGYLQHLESELDDRMRRSGL